MTPEEATEALATGRAWEEFCEGLKQVGRDVLRDTAPDSPLDLAEAHRYLTHGLRSAFERIMEGGDPEHPRLTVSLGGGPKLGWDNPDNVHHGGSLRGDLEYRFWGKRGDAHYVSIGVYAGSFSKGGSRTVAFLEIDELEIGADGRFEVILSAREHPGNWIRLEPDTTSIMIRQTFWNRSQETAGDYHLERLDPTTPPGPLRPEFVTAALKRSLGMIRGTNQIIFDWADRFGAMPNRFQAGDPEANRSLQGTPDNLLAGGWWRATPEEAIVIDFTPPRCRYWSFVLSNYWGQSFDYDTRPICTNARRAKCRPDGSVRLVVAHRDPGLENATWIDTAGHDEGVWQFRWLAADENVVPVPRVELFSELTEL